MQGVTSQWRWELYLSRQHSHIQQTPVKQLRISLINFELAPNPKASPFELYSWVNAPDTFQRIHSSRQSLRVELHH